MESETDYEYNGEDASPMQELIDGYKRFRAGAWPERQRLYESLAGRGQKPRVLVLACVDSRVDPAAIFDAGPGEILVVRNVANLVPPYEPDGAYHGTSAALEFGVRVLEVSDILVLGHGQCGGVAALLNGAPETARDFVEPWMQMAAGAREKAILQPPDRQQLCCEHEVIKVSIANLLTFPWIARRVTEGTLTIHGAWYAIKSGALTLLNAQGMFEDAA